MSHTVEKNNDGSTNKGMKPFDINRAVYGMRTIGSDHAGLEKMCGMLNLPKPAKNSVNSAARELRSGETITYIGVSVDGSWQRRGFSPLNGIVAALSIDNGKVIDIEPMSRYCQYQKITI